MRFRFRNLGPIRDGELELGRLTILVGRNNTGKTWVLNALCGFFHPWRKVTARDEFQRNPELAELLAFLREGAAAHASTRPVSRAVLQRERQILIEALSRAYSRFQLPRVLAVDESDFGGSVRAVPGPMPENLKSFSVRMRNADLVLDYGDGALHLRRQEKAPIRPHPAERSRRPGAAPPADPEHPAVARAARGAFTKALPNDDPAKAAPLKIHYAVLYERRGRSLDKQATREVSKASGLERKCGMNIRWRIGQHGMLSDLLSDEPSSGSGRTE